MESDALSQGKLLFFRRFSLSVFFILSAAIFFACASVTPEMRYNRAIDHIQQGRLVEGEKEYRLAVSEKPTLIEAHNNLGVLYLKLGRLTEAEQAFQKALLITPDYLKALRKKRTDLFS